jgi:hypothetical protein
MKARLTGLLGMFVALAYPAFAQQPSVSLELIPNSVFDSRQVQLYITVESSQELDDAILEIRTSTDFKAEPSTIQLPSIARSTIPNVTITPSNSIIPSGDQAITVTLSQSKDPAKRKVLVSKLLKFPYTPEISLRLFFIFATLGLVVGYWVRLIVKVLGAVTPPPAAPEPPAPAQGPITQFVQAHYYLVDFSVTVALAFIVLATLVQNGRPPQAGATWYGALASGVGIGLFTNSELLTRLRK